jgi:hypothetical protein
LFCAPSHYSSTQHTFPAHVAFHFHFPALFFSPASDDQQSAGRTQLSTDRNTRTVPIQTSDHTLPLRCKQIMSFLLTPFHAMRNAVSRHPYISATASLAAVGAAGYWAYNKAAPIIADIRSMMQLMEEQQKAESLKARELDPCVCIFFEAVATRPCTIH